MPVEKRMTKRELLRRIAALGLGLACAAPILAACGPTPSPEVIKETVVEKTVILEAITREGYWPGG